MNELEIRLFELLLNQVQFTENGSWFIDCCESDFDFICECNPNELPYNINYLMRKCLNNKKAKKN